ncbi:MAG: basic amino acid ABC transporter substrate-binding protein [Campylobacter sp.]
MKKIFALILVGLTSLFANELKIGTAANYPPFEFVDSSNKITGFDIDLVAEISKRAGFEYKLVNMSFDGLIPALKAGKINAIISAMSATEDRRKSIDFSTPYYSTENIYLRKKGNSEIADKQSLNGKKIAVQQGTVQELAANKIDGAKVIPAEDSVPLIIGLKAGKFDAVILDSLVGYGFLKKNQDLEEFFKEADGSEGFSLAFNKDKDTELIAKINTTLDEIKKDGIYDKLLEKYDLK